MAETIFDVVTEDPEIPHVPDQVQPPPVQEHRSNEGNQDGTQRQIAFRPTGDERRYNTVPHEKRLEPAPEREFVKEGKDVDQDQENGNEWK